MRDRYDYFRELVKTRGVLSIGLSIFKYLAGDFQDNGSDQSTSETETDSPVNLLVRVATYNLYCKPKGEFTTDECAAKFLTEHDFDFKRQDEWGIPYVNCSSLNGDVDCNSSQEPATLRNLFRSLIGCKKQIVLHNGFLDLAFLYGSFFEPLPEQVATFAGHLKVLFPSGVFDTKFLSIVAKLNSSYLEYIFYCQQRKNLVHMKNKKRSVVVTFAGQEVETEEFLDLRNMKTHILSWNPTPGKESNICAHFSSHGWCSNGNNCRYTHNVDAILDYESVKHLIYEKSAKKKQQYINRINFLRNLIDQDLSYQQSPSNVQSPVKVFGRGEPSETSNAHHSGYDAFMTGYSFVTFVNDMFCYDDKHRKSTINLVYVSGHKHPFRIQQSDFSRVSSSFKAKVEGVFASCGKTHTFE